DVLADKPLTDGNGDVGRLERALGREEPLLVFILLADDPRTIRRVEELLFDLSLNERPLFLDDDDRLETIGKSSNTTRLERPNHSDLVEPESELVGLHFVDAELIEGLADVEVALARGDDAQLWRRAAAHDDAVELIGPRKCQHCGALEVMQPRFLRQGRVVK